MEIIHLTLGKANPNRSNGVNKVVNSLAEAQIELGYNVSVWGITHNLERNFPERNYRTTLFKASKNKVSIGKDLMEAIEKLKGNLIVHIHGGFIPEFYHVAKMLVANKLNYIFTPHGSYNMLALKKNNWLKKFYMTLFENRIINNAKAIHLIGQSEIDAMTIMYPKSKKVLIPNGQNFSEIKSAYRKENSDSMIFGFCGRIDIHTKGLDLLIEAFSIYKNQMQGKGELWIIGDGSELNNLKVIAKENSVLDSVKFLGGKYGDEKIDILTMMDVFLHPSRNEGLPGAVLEAASLSIPCIVSKESNMSEYVENHQCGIGLKQNTAYNIAVAMQKMLIYKYNNEIHRLQANAKKMVHLEFKWNVIAKKLIEIYKK